MEARDRMRIVVIVARVLVAYAIFAFLGMLLMSGWGGPPSWSIVAPIVITLAVLACPTSLLVRSRIVEVGVVFWLLGLMGVMLFLGEWTSSLPHIAVLFGLIAKPTLVGISEIEKWRASNQALHGTAGGRADASPSVP